MSNEVLDEILLKVEKKISATSQKGLHTMMYKNIHGKEVK